MFWDICFEVLIGGLIFEKYLHISQTTYLFNLFNYWVYSSISNLGLYIGINIFYVLLSLLIVILIYHKKENVVIASES